MIDAPKAFHVMAKPTGAICNLRCAYCFYEEKSKLYPAGTFRMPDETMELYIRQTIEAHQVPEVTIAWQGGEPTLMGLDFFRRAVGIEKKYQKPRMRIENTLQTNGALIDENWCRFFHENNFLVGLSMDGPKEMHDAYRRDKNGASVFYRVVRAARLMQKHNVDFNILCTVNAVNGRRPLEVYRFFRDELKARFIQFIPIVEKQGNTESSGNLRATDRSVRPDLFGRFMIDIFDEWVRRDVGTMFVQFFDGVLASYVRGVSTLCVLQPACGLGVALEHNGDVYSCDHFVEPDHLLGNIRDTTLGELVSSEKQKQFGLAKSSSLPRHCRECGFLFTCHGECPKNRLLRTQDGEPGLNWLCVGLKAFFVHTGKSMRTMADLIRSGRNADEIMKITGQERKGVAANPGRNEPCPCGSGRKFKKCHGGPAILKIFPTNC